MTSFLSAWPLSDMNSQGCILFFTSQLSFVNLLHVFNYSLSIDCTHISLSRSAFYDEIQCVKLSWVLPLVWSTGFMSSPCLIECIIFSPPSSSVPYLRDLYHFPTSCLGLKSSESSGGPFSPYLLHPVSHQAVVSSTFLISLIFSNLGGIPLHSSTSSWPLSLSVIISNMELIQQLWTWKSPVLTPFQPVHHTAIWTIF